MTFLGDEELAKLLKGPDALIENVGSKDHHSKDDPIQPCSVDLTIKDIYKPAPKSYIRAGEDEKVLQRKLVKLRERTWRLAPGSSVKVSTEQEFRLDNRHGALLMAPARLTRCGVLIPDVGHIDPGFHGRLTLTLINAGREEYTLVTGDVVATVLLFRLGSDVHGLSTRDPKQSNVSSWPRDLHHLSPDLLATAEKAAAETRRIMHAAGWRNWVYNWILPLVLAAAIGYAAHWFDLQYRTLDLTRKIEGLERDIHEIQKKLPK